MHALSTHYPRIIQNCISNKPARFQHSRKHVLFCCSNITGMSLFTTSSSENVNKMYKVHEFCNKIMQTFIVVSLIPTQAVAGFILCSCRTGEMVTGFILCSCRTGEMVTGFILCSCQTGEILPNRGFWPLFLPNRGFWPLWFGGLEFSQRLPLYVS